MKLPEKTRSPEAPEVASTPADGPGRPAKSPRGGRRERLRSKPGIGQAYRIAVFAAGLLCIAIGVALAVLPGPLTIPPVLLGLWIWSTEFRFAQRFFDAFKDKAREAWTNAKRHPRSSSAITLSGLIAAGAAVWAVSHFELIARGQEAAGL